MDNIWPKSFFFPERSCFFVLFFCLLVCSFCFVLFLFFKTHFSCVTYLAVVDLTLMTMLASNSHAQIPTYLYLLKLKVCATTTWQSKSFLYRVYLKEYNNKSSAIHWRK